MQRHHVHLIVEAENAEALSSGVRSVAIRIARYVNDLLSRRGPLWADRWHGRALTSPREVRNALLYVLANFRKHSERALPHGIDPYSSAAWFDGWRSLARRSGREPPSTRTELGACPVAPARTWLARLGWRRHGLLALNEAPAR